MTKDGLFFIAEAQVVEGLDELIERAHQRSPLTLRPELTVRATTKCRWEPS